MRVADPISGLSLTVENQLADNTANKTKVTIVSTGSNAPYRHEESDELDATISRHYEVGLRCSGWFNTVHKRLLPADCPFILETTLVEANGCLVRSSGADADLNYSVTNPFVTVPVVSIMDATCLQHMRQKWHLDLLGHPTLTSTTSTHLVLELELLRRYRSMTVLTTLLPCCLLYARSLISQLLQNIR